MKRIAVITGASSGMGREFVLQLDKAMKHIDEIWVIARRAEKLMELEALTEHKLVVCPVDLAENNEMERVSKHLQTEKPHISMLVNAAGFGIHGTFEESDEKDSVGMIDVNIRALTKLTRICLPYMAKGGRIINLASSASFVPQPKFAVYAASKSYVLSFSRALQVELKARNISVTSVCPGPVDTEFFRRDNCDINKTFYKKLVMAKPDAVVKQAIEDAKSRKEISVYGGYMKAFRVLCKIVPHGVMLAVMKRIL